MAARDGEHRVRLAPLAEAVLMAACKDMGMGLGEGLSFIVEDWARLKMAALVRASFDCAPSGRSAQDARGTRQAGVKERVL